MRRRHVLNAAFLPLLAGGCVAPIAPSGPPPGATTAQAAYPVAGARWRVRVSGSDATNGGVEERDITAAPIDFNGGRDYGLVGPQRTVALDPVTFNAGGSIVGGRMASLFAPSEGPFLWPLWVGKSWDTRYAFTDFVYGRVWPAARGFGRVAALEDVTVPAGTFRAYRIDYRGGVGTQTPANFRGSSDLGIETRETHWYAPDARLIVKSVVERSGSHFRGAGRTVTELASTPR